MADGDSSPTGYENQQSLVKYDNPVLVIKHPEKPTTTGSDGKVYSIDSNHQIINSKSYQPRLKPVSLDKTRPSADGALDSKKETEEILNEILPPRCWEEDGQLWTQTVHIISIYVKAIFKIGKKNILILDA